ncbi:MAG: tetratricopeptide repeat protein, partial [Bdellovibrio sp.]
MSWGTTNMLVSHLVLKFKVSLRAWRVAGPVAAFLFLGTWTHAEEEYRQPSSSRNAGRNSASVQRSSSRRVGALGVGALVNVQSSDLRKNPTQLPAFSQSLFSRPSSSASAVDLSRVKPPSSQQFFRGNSNQAELERATNQQIDELFKLTQRFKDSPRRGELWLRLAELYVEKASLIQMRLQEDYDQQIREYIGKKSNRKPKLNLESALAYNRRAIQLYEWFVRDFPKDPKIDQALFFLGYNHYELNNTRRGTDFYARLVREFPKSSYVVESHFALAEYYFENEKWEQAHENYAKVAQTQGHRLSLFSVYKSAWSSYRSGQNTRALKEMERALRGLRSVEDKNRLEAEAVRDLILVYAEVGRPGSAISYLREWAGEKSESA